MRDISSYIEKFPEENRTFKSRVEFIRDLFMNPYSKTEIMARCVQHKLKRSLEAYSRTLYKSSNILQDKDPLHVLKRLK